MRKYWILVIPMLLCFSMRMQAQSDEIIVRVWLFQGTLMEDRDKPVNIEILSFASHPGLAFLKNPSQSSEKDFKGAAIEALMEIKNLKTLDDLFKFERPWQTDNPRVEDSIVAKQLAYRVSVFLKQLAPPKIAVRAVISKTKEGSLPEIKSEKQALRQAFVATRDEDKMENILDQQLLLQTDDPLIVEVPSKEGVYFMIILLTTSKSNNPEATPKEEKEPEFLDLTQAPSPLHKVIPDYPEDLRQRSISGDVGLRIIINAEGKVERVNVEKSLHPYLDYTAMQAFRQWVFEPALRKGKPIRAVFRYSYHFDLQFKAEDRDPFPSASKGEDVLAGVENREILAGCAEYCRRMAERALFFICEETIKETRFQLKTGIDIGNLKNVAFAEILWESPSGRSAGFKKKLQIMNPERTERSRYLSDYQLIKTWKEIEERRLLIMENSRDISKEKRILDNKRFSFINPIININNILGQDRQIRYDFRIVEEERIHGNKAYVLEAKPKSGSADGLLSARIWIDKKNLQVHKCEIKGIPLEGYDDVLRDCVLLNISPNVLITYDFGMENQGLLFPESTTIRVSYPIIQTEKPVVKLKADLTYKKYKYFDVDTIYEIRK